MEQTRVSHGFGPCIDSGSRTLILGSFPSVKSREASFFYGHPQNRFWKVLEAIFEDNISLVDVALSGSASGAASCGTAVKDTPAMDVSAEENVKSDIAAKKAFLGRHHIALYDVIEACTITGSSDASIRDVVPADIVGLLRQAPIERIFVNGKTAKKYYDKYLFPVCGQTAVCLPSTSPANAAWSLDRLAEAWRCVAKAGVWYVDPQSSFYADKDIRDGYLDMSGQLPLIRFHSLEETGFVDAAFTTRLGGVSTGVLGSLNLGFNRGDTEENLKANFDTCARAMNTRLDEMIATDQIHETKIIKAERSMGLGSELTRKVTGVDGFWADTPGLTLCASFADCLPVYLADPVGHRISLVHSGWKGTVGQIAGKAVKILESQGSRPENMIAVVGPSISGDRYEVTEDVIAAFRGSQGNDSEKEVSGAFRKGSGNYSEEELAAIFRRTDAKHYLLDLWAAIYFTLVHGGVLPENIHFSGICTWENADILWSHRRSGGRRGNMNAFLKIRE